MLLPSRQQGSVPELDGSLGFLYKMAASRFGDAKTSRRPSPSSDIRGLPALLPVICSKTHNGGTARKILYNSSPYTAVISRAYRGGKHKEI